MTHTLTFSPEGDGSFFQELPATAAVFLLRGEGEPYVSKTANLRRRLQRLLGPQLEQSKKLNLRNLVREIEYTPTGSDFESQFLLYKILRQTFPKTYAKRLRLRPAPLVKLHLENEYPRASVTTRLGRLSVAECGVTGASPVERSSNSTGGDGLVPRVGSSSLYYGPFPSRASAEKFASDALDFFKMRRCTEDLHPDPSFPGCVYSEMKMCLAPCFKGCTDDDYQTEVARVQRFFDTNGESLSREFSEQRDRASADLAFEEAAAVHAKLEKLKPMLSQLPEIVHRIDQLNAMVVQPSAEPDAVCLFRFHRAQIAGPLVFKVERQGHSAATTETARPQTMESRVEEATRSFSSSEISAAERNEHLAILKRWYYRSTRVGEVFFANENSAWPLRRLVRGIGRVYRGEREQELNSFSATSANSGPSDPA